MTPVVVVGNGLIGGIVARRLAPTRTVTAIPARDLVGGHRDREIAAAFAAGGACVFAHGRNVNVASFDRDYDDLLASRLAPLDAVRRVVDADGVRPSRVRLVSSTVAYAPAELALVPRSLTSMQKTFEARFRDRFADCDSAILRVGTVIEAGGQVLDGLERLKRTLLVKRLRMADPVLFPWADAKLIGDCVERSLDGRGTGTVCVAYPEGRNLNELLDLHQQTSFNIRISSRLFRAIWQRLGVHPEFFAIDRRGLNETTP